MREEPSRLGFVMTFFCYKREYVNHCDFDRKSGINLSRVAVGVLSRWENKCLQVLT